MGLIVCIGVAAAPTASAAEVKIAMSQGRTVYQANERIYLGIVRSGPAALPAGNLVLTVSGEDASRLRAQDRVDHAAGKRCGGPQRVRGDACGDRGGD